MNRDIRLCVDFWAHPKTVKLERRLGLEGVRSLQVLWCWAAQNRTDGTLKGMDDEDIAIAAGWNNDPKTLVDGLLECKYLSSTPGGYGGRTLHLHDWEEHQPYVAKAQQRREKARDAAAARWGDASDASSNAKSKSSNAKTEIEQCPLPSPDPSPDPKKKNPPISPRKRVESLLDEIKVVWAAWGNQESLIRHQKLPTGISDSIRVALRKKLTVEEICTCIENYGFVRGDWTCNLAAGQYDWSLCKFLRKNDLADYADRDALIRQCGGKIIAVGPTEEERRAETLKKYETSWREHGLLNGKRPDAYSTWPEYVQNRYDNLLEALR